jgi:hypothetical protein
MRYRRMIPPIVRLQVNDATGGLAAQEPLVKEMWMAG